MTSGRKTERAGWVSLSRLIALSCALSIALTPVPTAWAQTKAPAKAKKADAKDEAAGESVMLNFVNADIDAVVRAIGQYTGNTFVIDPRVKGTLTLVTERPVSKKQAFDQLLSALRLQGFTIVQTGNVMRVVPEADAKLQGGTVVAPRSQNPGGDQLVTQVFRLQYESATAMVPILRPLIAPNNTISAYPQNNTLVITDYAENLRRIQRIIESIDTPATSDLEMIPVKYGLAMEIASVVNRVLDEGARACRPGDRRGTAHLGPRRTPHQHADRASAEPGAADAGEEPDCAARPAGLDTRQHQRRLPAQCRGHAARAAAARHHRLGSVVRASDRRERPVAAEHDVGRTGSAGRRSRRRHVDRWHDVARRCCGRRWRRCGRRAGRTDPGRRRDELADHHGARTALSQYPRDHRQARRAPRAGGHRVADRRDDSRQGRRVRHPVAGAWRT